MANKLFVGGLSWDTDNDGLRDAFAEYGDVTDAAVIRDRDTGRSRGFGFVTFAQEGDAQDALEGMNGVELDGRQINVDVAHEKRRGGGGGGGRGRGGRGGGRGRY